MASGVIPARVYVLSHINLIILFEKYKIIVIRIVTRNPRLKIKVINKLFASQREQIKS